MPGNDNKDRTMRTGELLTRAIEQDSWDRIGGQDRRDRTDRTRQIHSTGQHGWDNRGRTVQVQQRQESRGQDCWGRLAGTGQLRWDSRDTIARTGQPGQDSQKKLSGKYNQARKQRTRLPEQDSKDRTARTGQGDRTTVTGPLATDIRDRITQTGQPGQVSLDG
jgi:hypothetical protein